MRKHSCYLPAGGESMSGETTQCSRFLEFRFSGVKRLWAASTLPFGGDILSPMSSNLRRLRAHCLQFAAFLLCASIGGAQSGRRIEGKVVDVSGGNVPGATITIFSDDQLRAIKADGEGVFVIPDLPPNTHFLEASFPGFFPSSIPITNNMPGQITFTLQVGEGGGPYDSRCYLVPPKKVSYEKRT